MSDNSDTSCPVSIIDGPHEKKASNRFITERMTPGNRRNPQIQRFLLTALFVVLLIRLVLFLPVLFDPQIAIRPDSHGYLSLATSLVTGGGYSGGANSTLDFFRTPGYPGFIAFLFMAFGKEIWIVVLFQLLMGVLIGFLLYRIAHELSIAALGVIAWLVFALMPNPVLWSMTILSEVLFALCLVLGFYFLALYLRSASFIYAFAAGVALGIGALVRPIGLVVLPVWMIGILFGRAIGFPLKRTVISSGLVLLGFFIIAGPWAYRNKIVWGEFNLSFVSKGMLVWYIAPKTLKDAEGISLEEARERLSISNKPIWMLEQDETTRFLSVILEHPLPFLKGYTKGILAALIGYGRMNLKTLLGEPFHVEGIFDMLSKGKFSDAFILFVDQMKQENQFRALTTGMILVGFQVVIYILALRGYIRFQSADPMLRLYSWLLVGTIFVLLLPVAHEGNARFRVPFEPALAFLAASGLHAIRKTEHQNEQVNDVEQEIDT